jgi:hypothetical protein
MRSPAWRVSEPGGSGQPRRRRVVSRLGNPLPRRARYPRGGYEPDSLRAGAAVLVGQRGCREVHDGGYIERVAKRFKGFVRFLFYPLNLPDPHHRREGAISFRPPIGHGVVAYGLSSAIYCQYAWT